MKKTIVVLVVACTILANFSAGSLVSAPIIQAQAQSGIGEIISSTLISFVTSIFKDKGDDNTKFKAPRRVDARDCHDEIRYYYKYVKQKDGSINPTYVGSVEIKFGEIVGNRPPEDYDYSKQVHYKENTHYDRIECEGATTSTPCTPRSLTCEEQNP